MNEPQISEAYTRLTEARSALFAAHEAATAVEHAYEDRKAEITVTTPPKELGSNDDIRAAKLVDLLAPQSKVLREAQAKERAAKLYFDKMQDDVRRIDALLRFMTINAPAATSDQLIEF